MDKEKEICDAILEYIDKFDFPEWHNLAQIQESVLSEQELSYGQIRRSLEKLQRDGYVVVKDINDDDSLRVRKTDLSRNFLQSGGYSNNTPMEKLDRAKLRILRYLNEPHVRQNSNLTEGAIRDYFYDIKDTTYFNTGFEELAGNKHIDRTSDNQQWQIRPLGETELNRLQTELDLNKNIKATEKNAEATANLVTATTYLKTTIDWNKWLTLGAVVGTFIVAIQQCNESNRSNEINTQLKDIQEKQLEQQLKSDSMSRMQAPPRPDTVYVIDVSPAKVLKVRLTKSR